jgi:hypothetical protein
VKEAEEGGQLLTKEMREAQREGQKLALLGRLEAMKSEPRRRRGGEGRLGTLFQLDVKLAEEGISCSLKR